MLMDKIDKLVAFTYELQNRKLQLGSLIEEIENDKEFPIHYRCEIRDVFVDELFTLENNLKKLENLLPRLYNDMSIIDGFNEADDKEKWRKKNLEIMENNIKQINESDISSVDKVSFIKTVNGVIDSINRL